METKIIVVLGTNASGKSALGLELAEAVGGEIISADSRQVYRGFDLCSGKVTADEMQRVPHHLLNIRDVGEPFSVADFQKMAYELIPDITARGRTPFIVGGTGLYIDSVVFGYELLPGKPDYAYRDELEKKTLPELSEYLAELGIDCLGDNPSDSLNKRRIIRILEKVKNGEHIEKRREPKYTSLQLGLTWPKEILHRRITDRLEARIREGMIDEVRDYLHSGGDAAHLLSLGLEYRHICWLLSGEYKTQAEFVEGLGRAIRQFAKRQLTWFKRNKDIIWLDTGGDYYKEALDLTRGFINN